MSARIYTTRRLKSASGADIKSTAGKYIRVKIHKETRQVSKVKPELWTEAANTAYDQRYPNDIDVKKPRKNKVKTAPPVTPPPIEKEDCPICQSELPKATTTLECGHSYCTKCILTWFQRKNSCPMCRAEVPEAAGQKGPRRALNMGLAQVIIENTNRSIENRYATVPARHILASRTRRWGNAGSNYALAVLANLSDAMEGANDETYDRLCPIYNPNT